MRHYLLALFAVLGCAVTATGQEAAPAAALPRVALLNVREVFDNGEHNAFTDMIRFHDQYYLTFRSCPDGHMVHPTASIVILRSRDLASWEQVHQFRVPLRDTRDPHFLDFNDRLFVYTGTWYSGSTTLDRSEYDLNLHLGYAVTSADGQQWSEPTLLEGTFGHYIWRATAWDGKAYLCGRRKQGFAVGPRGEGVDVESAMLVSDDGLIWKKHSLFQETRGDETAFQFDAKGSLLGIARRGSQAAELLRSHPPYTEWSRSDLGSYIGGPLLAQWGSRWVVGGRKSGGTAGPKTVLYWLINDQLHPFVELPSGGDNSYPGLIVLSDTRAVVSWYASHETYADGRTKTAIYLADLELTPAVVPQEQRSLIHFRSSFDDSQQPAYLTVPAGAASADAARPLVVSLHSWSADLQQRNEDLEGLIHERGWYCLQPNFRGVNDDPLACGSPAAQQDILDAVDWVQAHYAIDAERIYITGESGGGHMTLLMAARYPTRWTAASAWVGISDLASWHARHADDKYGAMLRQCCGGAPGASPTVDEQYRQRSPLTFMAGGRDVALDIAAGIHDGHQGSVPIRHSLDAFNALAVANQLAPIGDDEIDQLSREAGRLAQPGVNDEGFDASFCRQIYLRRVANRARVTIFEGGHEGLASATLAWFDAHATRTPPHGR